MFSLSLCLSPPPQNNNVLKMGGFSSQFGLFIQLASPMQSFQNATVIISGNCGHTDGKVSCHWNFKGTQQSSHPAEWESNEPSGKVLGVGVEWVLKQQLITAEARRSPRVSDLWLGLSRGKKKKKSQFLSSLSRGCLWLVPSLTHAYIMWQVFNFLNWHTSV